MKKLLISMLLFLSVSASADALEVNFAAGVFGVSNISTKNNSNYSLPEYGAILSADSNRYVGVDVMLTDNRVAASVKLSFDVDAFKVSVGVGIQTVDFSLSDDTDSWDDKTINSSDEEPAAFIELSHSSGVFLRYGETNLKDEVIFNRTHRDIGTGVPVLANQKKIAVNEKINSYMLGYRVAF